MVIKNKHPQYASDTVRLEKLRDIKRLCRQKLAAAQAALKAG